MRRVEDDTGSTLSSVPFIPVFTLVRQPRLEPCTSLQHPDGAFVSTSYTYLRHPLIRMHPGNLVPLTPAQADAISRIERVALPADLADTIDRLRFPVLWDAVRTWAPEQGGADHHVRTHLVAHLREARAHHHLTPLPTVPVAAAPPAGSRLSPGATLVLVDRAPCPAVVLHDIDYTAIGTSVRGITLTTVIETKTANHLRLHFSRLPPN